MTDLGELQQQMLVVLGDTLMRLKSKMADTDEFNSQDSSQAQRLARSIAAFSGEVRKHDNSIEKAAASTSREDKAAIAEQWLAALPRDLLKPVVDRLAKQLKAR